MATTSESSGSQTATIDTEHSLHTNTGGKLFGFLINLTNLASGDVVQFRIKSKVRDGDSRLLEVVKTYDGDTNIEEVARLYAASPPGLTANTGIEFTLEQIAGTGRAFSWHIISW